MWLRESRSGSEDLSSMKLGILAKKKDLGGAETRKFIVALRGCSTPEAEEERVKRAVFVTQGERGGRVLEYQQTSNGSLSAVSTPIFASKGKRKKKGKTLDESDKTYILLHRLDFKKSATFVQIVGVFSEFF